MEAPRSLPSRRKLARRPRRRVASALRRQPIIFWVFAGLAAATTFLVLYDTLQATAEGAETYGALVPVVVARADLFPGDPIGPDQVEVALLPQALVPTGALDTVPAPTTVRHDIAEGEAIIARRLAPHGSVGIAALLDGDERAIAIPLPSHRVPVEVGQRVDVLATTDPAASPGRSPTSVLAADARVVSIAEGGVTVAVTDAESLRIATALASAVVTIAVRAN